MINFIQKKLFQVFYAKLLIRLVHPLIKFFHQINSILKKIIFLEISFLFINYLIIQINLHHFRLLNEQYQNFSFFVQIFVNWGEKILNFNNY